MNIPTFKELINRYQRRYILGLVDYDACQKMTGALKRLEGLKIERVDIAHSILHEKVKALEETAVVTKKEQ